MADSDVTFDTAVATLQSMFQDIDNEIITALLVANNGRMEDTVTQLLEIDEQARTSKAHSAAAGAPIPAAIPIPRAVPITSGAPAGSASSPTTTAAAAATTTTTFDLNDGGIAAATAAAAAAAGAGSGAPSPPARRAVPAASRSQSKWRHPLPDDFLRVPGIGSQVTSTPEDQVHMDELVAQMLADRMVLEELRADPALLAMLQQEIGEDLSGLAPSQTAGAQQRTAVRGANATTGAGSSGGQASAGGGRSWTSKLSTMSQGLKRKVTSFAMRFRRGNTNNERNVQYRNVGDDDDDAGVGLLSQRDTTTHRAHRGGHMELEDSDEDTEVRGAAAVGAAAEARGATTTSHAKDD